MLKQNYTKKIQGKFFNQRLMKNVREARPENNFFSGHFALQQRYSVGVANNHL